MSYRQYCKRSARRKLTFLGFVQLLKAALRVLGIKKAAPKRRKRGPETTVIPYLGNSYWEPWENPPDWTRG